MINGRKNENYKIMMTKTEQQIQLSAIFDEIVKTQDSKGNDYAGEDRLSNFKLVSQIVGITPEQVLLVFIATKAVRIGNLQGNKTPNNESVDDSIIDLVNYGILLKMARQEAFDDAQLSF